MIDNHIHTKLCKHAEGELHDYVEKAIRLGMTEISFTDHIPLPDNFDLAHRMELKEMDLYAKWVQNAQKRYREITIRFGIEADFYEGLEKYTEEFLSRYDFDIAIMSVHFIRHWPEGNWVFDYNFPEKSKDEIYRDYLSTVKRGLETGLFDVLGHVDMVKDTGDSLINIVPTEVDSLLETLKKMDMCIEINSSGFRKKVGEPYPGFDWLALIKEKSVPLTIGSDAHHPNQVGLEFDSVYQHLTKEGVKEIITFDNRRKIKMVIG